MMQNGIPHTFFCQEISYTCLISAVYRQQAYVCVCVCACMFIFAHEYMHCMQHTCYGLYRACRVEGLGLGI